MQYRNKFLELTTSFKEDFTDFCNVMILDLNSLLFEGLINLEEIKSYEDVEDDLDVQATMD